MAVNKRFLWNFDKRLIQQRAFRPKDRKHYAPSTKHLEVPDCNVQNPDEIPSIWKQFHPDHMDPGNIAKLSLQRVLMMDDDLPLITRDMMKQSQNKNSTETKEIVQSEQYSKLILKCQSGIEIEKLLRRMKSKRKKQFLSENNTAFINIKHRKTIHDNNNNKNQNNSNSNKKDDKIDMTNNGENYLIHPITYHIAIRKCTDIGDYKMAWKLFRDAKYDNATDAHLFTQMIQLLGNYPQQSDQTLRISVKIPKHQQQLCKDIGNMLKESGLDIDADHSHKISKTKIKAKAKTDEKNAEENKEDKFEIVKLPFKSNRSTMLLKLQQTFNEMTKEFGILPTNATYSAMINACRKYRAFTIGEKFWMKFNDDYNNNNNNNSSHTNDGRLFFDTSIYSSIIFLYIKINKMQSLQKAKELYFEMIYKHNIKPNEKIVASLLSGYANIISKIKCNQNTSIQNQIAVTQDKIELQNSEINSLLYESQLILVEYFKHGLLKIIKDDDNKRKKVCVDIEIFNSMLNVYATNGDIKTCLQILSCLVKNQIPKQILNAFLTKDKDTKDTKDKDKDKLQQNENDTNTNQVNFNNDAIENLKSQLIGDETNDNNDNGGIDDNQLKNHEVVERWNAPKLAQLIQMPKPDTHSFNTVLKSLIFHEFIGEKTKNDNLLWRIVDFLFLQMKENDILSDCATYSTVFHLCGNVAAHMSQDGETNIAPDLDRAIKYYVQMCENDKHIVPSKKVMFSLLLTGLQYHNYYEKISNNDEKQERQETQKQQQETKEQFVQWWLDEAYGHRIETDMAMDELMNLDQLRHKLKLETRYTK